MSLVFLCAVVLATDGDTLQCRDGVKVRIAGIEARERGNWCHLPVCPAQSYALAKAEATRLTVGQTLRCVRHEGDPYRRTVASCTVNGRDVGCTLIASGAAAAWPKYRVRYRLAPCR